MFEDKFQQKTSSQDINSASSPVKKNFLTYENFEMLVIAIAVIVLGVSAFFYFTTKKNSAENNNNQTATSSDVQQGEGGRLPGTFSGGELGSLTGTTSEIRAESLAFADFYKTENDDFKASQEKFDLPINIKSDVLNYFDFSRKINIDKNIDRLNKNGFAVIDNPFSKGGLNNFSGLYQALLQKDLPIIITGDFLIYYYQNNLKEIYKEIENNVFYNDLWEINNYLFNAANSRYREEYNKVGLTNDPVLESKRKEAAYFAVALELLKPKEAQISSLAGEKKKFSAKEARIYDFSLPVYLEEDVNKELNYIYQSKNKSKSPVFLYPMDYGSFTVPVEYQTSAKLYNYYQALKWVNSLFPLYYKSENCSDCRLDKNDWRVNMAAASYIAEDFSENQEIKNKWAKIYKIYSFFSGLRSDLTYLDYNNALVELFGKNYKIDGIFAADNKNIDADLLNLQNKIASREFLAIEGGIGRNDPAARPNIGFKMLQDSYWPSDYIFSKLTAPNAGKYLGDEKEKDSRNITKCAAQKTTARCKGTALDVINLIHNIPSSNEYFQLNSNYENYAKQAILLMEQLANFDAGAWHNSNYWLTLYSANALFSGDKDKRPFFGSNALWQEKNLNSALALWVNAKLPADQLTSATNADNKFNAYSGDYNYIEPDLAIVNELLANTKMLTQAFLALGVIDDKDFTYGKLNDLAADLEAMKNIIIKELSGSALSGDDKSVIYQFSKKFSVSLQNAKSIKLDFSGGEITESIDGVDMLIYIYQEKGKKVMVAGPVFNYQEAK